MIDFKVPRYWIQRKSGSRSYPNEIENWFSEDFDNYFIYHNPILIDLDIQNGRESSRDELGRPKNKRVLTFNQFKKEFLKEGEDFKDYYDYVMYQVRNKDTRPNYLWGSEEGSSIYFNDILELLRVFDSTLQTKVYCHYDVLRKIRGNIENNDLPSLYFTKIEQIKNIASNFSNLSPEFVLEKNKKWCFTTLYDDSKTAIGCDNNTAVKLIRNAHLGIERIKTVHNNG
ncbi:hypothetical protein [Gillisia sp. Hel_I_29]|uniref:hypothetical protein n=1 Tax=Gillisia sp. Hel_I_29 TaxID=1249975 RepID=UPI000555DD9D|nr:hypothetical protein [Gillisia sp. Hel_I_29]